MENPFVPKYSELTDTQKTRVAAIKDTAFDLLVLIATETGTKKADPRCLSIAKTKLEEVVMWAVKGVTNPPDISKIPETGSAKYGSESEEKVVLGGSTPPAQI